MRRRGVLLALVACCVVVAVLALGTGRIQVAPLDVVRTLLGNGSRLTNNTVLELRLPRVLAALLVGLALGMSGALFQSLTRNPLGSPDIVGFNYGAATGGLVAILVFAAGPVLVSAGAVAGAVVTAGLVYVLAWQRGVRSDRLALVGVGVSALLQSANFYLIVNADLASAARATVWITGSLNGRGWGHVVPLAIALAVLVPATLAGNRSLSMLEMGDDTAKALGVPVEHARRYLLVCGAALCAVATAAAGPIAFVALAAPQLARRLTRAAGPGLVAAGCMGALLVLTADFVAARLSTALPVGVCTAVLGGVYLAWLLRTRRRAAV